MMGSLCILNGDKEEKYFWTPDEPEQTRIAREKFDHYRKQGFVACIVVHDGKTGFQISQFDPEAEEIFMLGLADGG